MAKKTKEKVAKKPAKKAVKKAGKPAASKKPAKKAAKAVKAPAKKPVKKSLKAVVPSRRQAKQVVTSHERQHKIEQAAYYLAEKANFQGDPHQFWLAAVAEVDGLYRVQD